MEQESWERLPKADADLLAKLLMAALELELDPGEADDQGADP